MGCHRHVDGCEYRQGELKMEYYFEWFHLAWIIIGLVHILNGWIKYGTLIDNEYRTLAVFILVILCLWIWPILYLPGKNDE